jgi:hypothetical protein
LGLSDFCSLHIVFPPTARLNMLARASGTLEWGMIGQHLLIRDATNNVAFR